MGDRLTYCDVMESCEECPKYGDDCDGDKRNDDLISRADAIEAIASAEPKDTEYHYYKHIAIKILSELPSAVCDDCIWSVCNYNKVDWEAPSAEAVQGWIPCSVRLPEDLEAVNVTWVNHNPPVYYQHIKDVPKVDTAVYYRGVWYWWDATVIDLLGEYGGAYIHGIEPIDKDIVEVTAWMPLPKPYREDGEA